MTDGIDRLEERLRRVAREADPVTDAVLENARAAFTLRDLDAELAELVADSAVDDGVPTRAGTDDVRMLSFAASGVSVELDADPDPHDGGVKVTGLVSGARDSLTVVRQGSRAEVSLGADGRFAFRVDRGPLRLELTAADGRRVVTAWILV